MGYLSEKVAYLKGLADGLDFDASTKEGKILAAIVEVLDEIAIEVDDIVIMQDDMQEQLDDVDTALSDLEDEYYALDDDLDELEEYDDLDEDWEEEYSFECPGCGDMVYFDPALLDDGVECLVCPNCEEKISIKGIDLDEE